MRNRLVYSFAKMVTDNLCTIEELPEEYQIPVTNYLANPETTAPKNHVINDAKKDEIHGALHLGNAVSYVETREFKTNGFVLSPFKTNTIFKDCISGVNPYPIDVDYQITHYEMQYTVPGWNPKVELFTTDYGFEIKTYGDIDRVKSNITILRVDIEVKAKNYEPMRFTVYIKSI